MPEETNKWTVMVYFSGDNNLSVEMAYALEQIKTVTKDNQNLSVFVYFDGFSSNVPTLYCDFTQPDDGAVKFYRSSNVKDKLIKRTIKPGQEFNENSASVNNILNFVDWCVKKDKRTDDSGKEIDDRKNKRYAMIFSGHSFGFMDWGLFKDEKADYYMTLSKLKWMFERITSTNGDLVKQAELDQAKEEKKAAEDRSQFTPWSNAKITERTSEILGKPLDLLGFDSCEMSSLEVGSQFGGLASTMVASEGSVPNAGWNYAQILLGKINKTTVQNPNEIAISFVDEFIKQQNDFALADISVDMAAWDLDKLPGLGGSFFALADSLMKCFDNKDAVSYNQMRRILAQVHLQCQTYLLEQYVDLGDFCGLLEKEINALKNEIDNDKIAPIISVGDNCRTVRDNIRKCILLTGYSGSDFQFSNGISLFFPWSVASYESAEKDYNKLSFIKDDNAGKCWNNFLIKYLYEVTWRDSNPLTPTDKDGNVIIEPETDSIVYESYVLRNERPQLPPIKKNGKRPPNDFKRPPNEFRRPPNSFKMLGDNLNVFLSRFMKMKNFETYWNQAGFSSTHVSFVPKKESPRAGVGEVPDIAAAKPIIAVPSGEPIEMTLEVIRAQLAALNPADPSSFLPDHSPFDNFISALDLSDPAALEMLRNLAKLLVAGSGFNGFSQRDAFEDSISSLADNDIKAKLTENLKSMIPE